MPKCFLHGWETRRITAKSSRHWSTRADFCVASSLTACGCASCPNCILNTTSRWRAARGCLANILVGILGGLIGGTLAKGAGFGDSGGFLGSIFVELLGSVLLRLAIEYVDRRPQR